MMEKRYFLVLMMILGLSYGMLHHHKDQKYLNHVQLVYQFRCTLPQPRAIPVDELLSFGPSPDEVFYPRETILARCAGAGCCLEANQVCGPVETRNVSLVFMVKHKIDQQRDRHHEIIHAIEHTKCGCTDREEISF